MARLRSNDREHRYVSDRLAAYMDEELVAEERSRVEAHLSTCQACRADLRTLRWTKGLLRQTPAIRVPRSFVVREADVVAARRPVRGRVPLFAAQWATAAVALLFVLVLGADLLTGAPGRLAKQAAPETGVAWVADETLEAADAEQVEEMPAEQTLTILAVEADVARDVKEEGVVETETTKAAEERVAAPLPMPTRSGEDDGQTPPPNAAGKPGETQGEPEALRTIGDTTPTAAPELMMAEPVAEDVAGTPTPSAQVRVAEEYSMPESADTPTAVSEAEVKSTEYVELDTAPPSPPIAWRVAEAVLGLALVGLLIATVWMRRRR
jgi:hypothetical protein